MIDIRSWPKSWNTAALRRLTTLPERPHSHRWPMLGMLAIGLVAGAALGGYAVAQRAHLRRISTKARRMGDRLARIGTSDEDKPEEPTGATRSNHRRETAAGALTN